MWPSKNVPLLWSPGGKSFKKSVDSQTDIWYSLSGFNLVKEA
jgi:hypothetical protein